MSPIWPVQRVYMRGSLNGDQVSYKIFEAQFDGQRTNILRVLVSCPTFEACFAAARLIGNAPTEP